MSRQKIWIFLFIIFLAGCASVPRKESTRIMDSKNRFYFKDLCDKYAIAWQWDHVSETIDMKLNGVNTRLLIGSNILLLGKEQIALNSPVVIDESSVMLPYDFKTKVLDRFETRLTEKNLSHPLKRVREIVIDAGHGGKDPGAIGTTGLKEKLVVIDVAQRLKKLIEASGIKVIMTRKDDTFISLEERALITSRSKADLFISIHANSNPVHSVHGVEAYSLEDLGTLEKNEAQRQENHKLMFKTLSMKSGSLTLEDIVSDMLYTNKQSVSSQLAANLSGAVAQSVKTQDRGDKQSHFFVLRNTLIPAVLVEIGFLTNPREERLLKTSEYRQKIAEGLAKGILQYANEK